MLLQEETEWMLCEKAQKSHNVPCVKVFRRGSTFSKTHDVQMRVYQLPCSLPSSRGCPGSLKWWKQLQHPKSHKLLWWVSSCQGGRLGIQDQQRKYVGLMDGLPLAFESQSVTREGSSFLWIRLEIVGPNVFSWSEPIQMRYLHGAWDQQTITNYGLSRPCGCRYRLPVWTLHSGQCKQEHTQCQQ